MCCPTYYWADIAFPNTATKGARHMKQGTDIEQGDLGRDPAVGTYGRLAPRGGLGLMMMLGSPAYCADIYSSTE